MKCAKKFSTRRIFHIIRDMCGQEGRLELMETGTNKVARSGGAMGVYGGRE